MASENVTLQSREKYYFSKQNIYTSTDVIKHFGTNFEILNIFWKQKIVKTVWPVHV